MFTSLLALNQLNIIFLLHLSEAQTKQELDDNGLEVG